MCSTRPHNFLHILPADVNKIVVNLAAAVDCPQLVPKYHSKVLVYLSKLPNLFVYIDNMFSLQEEFMRHVY